MKKKFKILSFSIWRLLAYFIIYSIVGFIIETVFAIVTKGVLESRQSFLVGPFCAIYGVGAVAMILFLQYFKKNKYSLFFGGFIIGSIVEYLVSLIGEWMLHVKWWDYSDQPFNINGRICVGFSLFWGVLAIYLISHFNPKIDKMFEKIKLKISHKAIKIIISITIFFMLVDCIITGVALKTFFVRLVCDYNIEVQYVNEADCNNWRNSKYPKYKEFSNKYFKNEYILKVFPNLKVLSKDGKIIFAKDIFKDIQPYYIMLFNKQ